jgi:hypothetical protein
LFRASVKNVCCEATETTLPLYTKRKGRCWPPKKGGKLKLEQVFQWLEVKMAILKWFTENWHVKMVPRSEVTLI